MTSLIFFGSDQYSAIALSVLLEHWSTGILENISVITDRPKPVGKGLVTTPSPVEILAKTRELKVSYYPDFDHSLITKDTLGLCASFDHLIPADIISLFGGNLYNLHPSLLPQYRNVSPVQYAIAMGDAITGITLFRISTGIDNGAIIAQVAEPIKSDDTTTTLTPRLFQLGAELFLSSIKNNFTPSGILENRNTGKLIYTHRLTRDSGFIEWPVLSKLLASKSVSTAETSNELLKLRLTRNPVGDILYDLLRALTPWPGVWSKVPTNKKAASGTDQTGPELTEGAYLRLTLESVSPEIKIKLAGKPKAISYSDFAKYYLG